MTEPDNGNNSRENDGLAGYAEAMAKLKTEITNLETDLKLKEGEFAAAGESLQKIMEAAGVDSFKSHGFTFFLEERTSVKTPKTVEDKRALFEFLKEKEIFDEIASVNSQTLNALYRSLSEEAASNGVLEFKMPGVEAPTVYTNLKMRKS